MMKKGITPHKRGNIMSFKEKATDFAVRQAIKYARKDFDRNTILCQEKLLKSYKP